MVCQQGWLLQVEVSRELFGALNAMCFFRPTHRRTVGFERCHSFGSQTIVLAKNLSDPTAYTVYDCARQPRRGLWNPTMDLPSSYSLTRFIQKDLTD